MKNQLLTLLVCILSFSCATNPFTGKKTMAFMPNSQLLPMAFAEYDKFLSENKVIKETSDAEMISRVGQRISVAAERWLDANNHQGYLKDYEWEYNLVEDESVNAWCMPGGKIGIYSGMLEVTKNTNGLAAVMGHEVAHAVAKHSVERASRGVLLNTGTKIIDIASGGVLSKINNTTGMNAVGLLSQLGIMNPFNRKQESEADYLGMIFSSLSGYDIRETVNIWKRMKEFNKGKEPAEFMSTHPSADNRIKKLNNWMNEVILDYPPIKFS